MCMTVLRMSAFSNLSGRGLFLYCRGSISLFLMVVFSEFVLVSNVFYYSGFFVSIGC